MIWVAVALAGALGSACRFLLDHAVTTSTRLGWPLGTVAVNVSGSFVAGLVGGLGAARLLPAGSQLVIAGGFLGAYTTFSTAMFESQHLLEDGAPLAAIANLLAPLLLATGAAALGWWLAP